MHWLSRVQANKYLMKLLRNEQNPNESERAALSRFYLFSLILSPKRETMKAFWEVSLNMAIWEEDQALLSAELKQEECVQQPRW